ncbi:hypothetical protein VP01_6g1 [Puccinia sorghi]|uniref:Uncharacterized protein n=1 Tax=Puccinia sorghi TaxID=27349 RepID=A0A0L6UDS4_9BASI|nr:hypothetical protein VP01_6g1 [Puccinia sorghi]
MCIYSNRHNQFHGNTIQPTPNNKEDINHQPLDEEWVENILWLIFFIWLSEVKCSPLGPIIFGWDLELIAHSRPHLSSEIWEFDSWKTKNKQIKTIMSNATYDENFLDTEMHSCLCSPPVWPPFYSHSYNSPVHHLKTIALLAVRVTSYVFFNNSGFGLLSPFCSQSSSSRFFPLWRWKKVPLPYLCNPAFMCTNYHCFCCSYFPKKFLPLSGETKHLLLPFVSLHKLFCSLPVLFFCDNCLSSSFYQSYSNFFQLFSYLSLSVLALGLCNQSILVTHFILLNKLQNLIISNSMFLFGKCGGILYWIGLDRLNKFKIHQVTITWWMDSAQLNHSRILMYDIKKGLKTLRNKFEFNLHAFKFFEGNSDRRKIEIKALNVSREIHQHIHVAVWEVAPLDWGVMSHR